MAGRLNRRRFLACAAALSAVGAGSAGAASTGGVPSAPGGTLNVDIPLPRPNVSLDPVHSSAYTTQMLAGFVYSRLFRFDSGLDPATTLARDPVPDLVRAYEIVDPTTYILKLYPDARFQPPLNRPVASRDVAASFQRSIVESQVATRAMLHSIVARLDTPDPSTVAVRLQQPYAPLLNQLADPRLLWILSQEAASGEIDPEQQPAGTGPWLWQGATDAAYFFARNPDYFLAGLPRIDGVVFRVLPSDERSDRFVTGELDCTAVGPDDLSPSDELNALLNAVPGAGQTRYIPNQLAFLFFGNRSGSAPYDFTADPRVRKAVSVALDRGGLLSTLYDGQGAWDNLINPGLGRWWLDPTSDTAGDSGRWFQQDVRTMRQLLTAAGYAGEELAFLYPHNAYGAVFNETAESVRRMLVGAGLNLRMRKLDYLRDYLGTGGSFTNGAPANSIVCGLATPFLDPDGYLFGMVSRDGNRNLSHVDDGRREPLVRAQRAELDPGARLDLVHRIQREQTDFMYYVPLVAGTATVLTQPWVEDFYLADDTAAGTESYAYLALAAH